MLSGKDSVLHVLKQMSTLCHVGLQGSFCEPLNWHSAVVDIIQLRPTRGWKPEPMPCCSRFRRCAREAEEPVLGRKAVLQLLGTGTGTGTQVMNNRANICKTKLV
jgi:hypothetical protein